jgi:hypothetical protein
MMDAESSFSCENDESEDESNKDVNANNFDNSESNNSSFDPDDSTPEKGRTPKISTK